MDPTRHGTETELELSRSMAALYSRAVRSETEADLYAAISSFLPELVRCDRASVTLIIPGTEELEVLGLEGEAGTVPLGQRLPLENSGPGTAIRKGGVDCWQASLIPDRVPAAMMLEAGLDHTMSAPLVVMDEPVGTINVAVGRGVSYGESDARLFGDIAKLISANLERFAAVGQLRERLAEAEAQRRQLERMNDLGLHLSVAGTEQEAFQAAAEVVGAVALAERVSLVVPTAGSQFEVVGVHTPAADEPGLGVGSVFPAGGSAVAKAFDEGRVVFLGDLERSPFPEHRRLVQDGLRSSLSVPIRAGDEVVGVMNCGTARGAFSADQLAMVTAVAAALGETLERVRAQERLAERNRELTRLSARLEHEASHDALTGLVNRRRFDRILGDLLQDDRRESPGSVIFVDVDHFKLVNDTAGHRAGDALLQRLAEVLVASVASDDTVSRFGGDEFAVLLPGCSLADAVRVAERLRHAAAGLRFNWEGRAFDITLSLGVSPIPTGADDPDEIVGLVDAACYGAKRGGRDRVSVGSIQDDDSPSSRTDREWATRLRRALEADELRLYAQPIVTTDGTESVAGAEILIRLEEPDGTIVSAGSFVPAAERLGLIAEIDTWVVDRVADTIIGPEQATPSLDFITVNLSPRSIESDAFLERSITRLGSQGVDADRIVFEITERSAMSDYSRVLRCIEALSALGCRFALDDFGIGFSTFEYLRRLRAVDFLKVDGSLIREVGHDLVARSIVRSIAQLATDLGIATVAECVEDESLVEELGRVGMGYAQGYALGRPQPVEGFLVDRHSNR